MFLGSTLSSASSGLDSVERQLAVLSQNISNASTPNYTVESVPLTSLDSAGGPAGVRTGEAQRQMDLTLQGELFSAVSNEAGTNTTSSALAAIDHASGTPGSGQDCPSLLGAVGNSFSTLSSDPASGSQQLDVLNKTGLLVDGIHALAGSLVQARPTGPRAMGGGPQAAKK